MQLHLSDPKIISVKRSTFYEKIIYVFLCSAAFVNHLLVNVISALDIDSIPIRQFGYGAFDDVTCSPDGKYFFASSGKAGILVDIETGIIVKKFSGHASDVYASAFSPNGNKEFSSSALDKLKQYHYPGNIRELSKL